MTDQGDTSKAQATASDQRAQLAFEILIRQHHRNLLAYARALTLMGSPGSSDEAEDLLHDALLVAYQNLHRYDMQRDFAAWVRGILRNRHLKSLRGRERAMDQELLEQVATIHHQWGQAATIDESYDHSSQQDVHTALRRCIEALGERIREAIMAYYMNDQSLKDCAAHLSSSVEAIKKRIQRGRLQLLQCLERGGIFDPADLLESSGQSPAAIRGDGNV